MIGSTTFIELPLIVVVRAGSLIRFIVTLRAEGLQESRHTPRLLVGVIRQLSVAVGLLL